MSEEVDWDVIGKVNPKFTFNFEKLMFRISINVKDSDNEYKNLKFIFPEGDETYFGTFAGIAKNEFNFFDLKPKDGDNIIDMGCNYGLVSMVCAALYPQCTIHAFDPCAKALENMLLNCFNNKIKNIVFHNTAVTASDKECLEFYSDLDAGPSCYVQSDFKKKDMTHVATCKNTHIKDVLDDIGNICYLKMDIEGAEYEVFDYLFENNKAFQDSIPYRVHIEVHGEEDKKQNLINKLNKVFINDKNIISI